MLRKDPKEYLVRQSNALPLSRNNLTAIQKKILCLLISRIKKDDKDFQDEYTFTYAELFDNLKIKDNYKFLRDSSIDLMKKVYQIKLHNEDKELLIIAPISSALINPTKKTITYKFDSRMRPYYLELKSEYTQFQLNIIMGLNSVYSQKLYELAKSIANQGDPSKRYSLAEWRYLLFIEPEEYKFYKDFRKKVFYVAQMELVEKTDLYIDFKEEKSGYRVNWIWIFVYKIETSEQRQAWTRETKFNQLQNKVRESLLSQFGYKASSLNNVLENVSAKKRAIEEAERLKLI